jgi:predicted transcriptional regulator
MRKKDLLQKKRRNKYSIVAEILKIAQDGTLKTAIMYKANLSFAQLNKYIGLLLDKRLMEQDEGVYTTTERGDEYIKDFEKIKAPFEDGSAGLYITTPPNEQSVKHNN